MLIKTIESYTTEYKLFNYQPLSVLKDCRIGIEASYYLKQLVNHLPIKDPLIHATASVPVGLKTRILRDLSILEQNKIEPFFVFDGLRLTSKTKKVPDENYSKMCEDAWKSYNEGKFQQASNEFGLLANIEISSLYKILINILLEKKMEFLVAPYLSWAQLAYMIETTQSHIDAIFGSSNILLFNVDRLIINFDFDYLIFSWLNKQTILSSLGGITNEQFLDICILLGSDLCPTFPPLEMIFQVNGDVFRFLQDTIKIFKSGINAILNYRHTFVTKYSDYLESFFKAVCIIKYHIVLMENGKLLPLNESDAPNDIHEFISTRLPEEIYFYLSRGIIGPYIINILISGILVENAPMDSNDTQEYKDFLDNIFVIQTQSLNLLTQPLHRFYQAKNISAYYWFDPDQEHKMLHKMTPSIYELVKTWMIKEDIVNQIKMTIPEKKINFLSFFKYLSDSKIYKESVSEKTDNNIMQSHEQILSSIYGKFFQLRSFINNDHSLSAWGLALLDTLKICHESQQNSVVLIFELLRLKTFRHGNLSATYQGELSKKTEEMSFIALISRVACLSVLHKKDIAWTGPLSQELFVFNSFIKMLLQTIRSLVEMITASLFMNQDANRERDDWLEFTRLLPFNNEYDITMGVVIKTYLEKIITYENPTSEDSKKKAIEYLKSTFISAENIEEDIVKFRYLWNSIVYGIKVADILGVVDKVESDRFLKANNWLQERI
ncbi:hypothetical protein T552_00891 [Pneumocystis carinii B80]|uniref:XPG N-terminal domain-containing protein n=1 Tax=Pneumocystis carinii (strain B80) TaxID=1408658 RepID=A0A0W4ZMU7_PNEC8|nr:hypothetical protein T552_00891 [Pneumocystis carinii B80]KTW29683.1 hypothetical protein T552_00891 [Pneumocystis carinii B80]